MVGAGVGTALTIGTAVGVDVGSTVTVGSAAGADLVSTLTVGEVVTFGVVSIVTMGATVGDGVGATVTMGTAAGADLDSTLTVGAVAGVGVGSTVRVEAAVGVGVRSNTRVGIGACWCSAAGVYSISGSEVRAAMAIRIATAPPKRPRQQQLLTIWQVSAVSTRTFPFSKRIKFPPHLILSQNPWRCPAGSRIVKRLFAY